MQPLRATTVLTLSLVSGGVLLAYGVRVAAQTVTEPPMAGTPLPSAEDLVVGVAGLGLAVTGCWLTLVTLACVRDLACGHTVVGAGPSRPGGLRRALLRACAPTVSAAVLCVAHPATAEPGGVDHPGALQGLPLPERPVLTVPHEPPTDRPHTPGPTRVRTVLPGDCLWTIAASLLGPQAAAAEVDRGWRALYRVNRDLVGSDPDLVVPGTRLRVPASLPPPRHPSR
jgi:nucleoid-associated protein YgaU